MSSTSTRRRLAPIGKGRQSRCIECSKPPFKERKLRSFGFPRVKGKRLSNRARHLRYDIGIELEEYDRMFKEQEGKCAICGTENSGHVSGHMLVDHNHTTKAIRRLLCFWCNLMIGHARESPEILRRGALYLEECLRNAIT